MIKKVLVISEELFNPIDEGIKKVAFNIFQSLKTNFLIVGICNTKSDSYPQGVQYLKINKSFISINLIKVFRDSNFSDVIYIPGACGSLFSLIRSTFLNIYGKYFHFGVKLFLLQPKEYNLLNKSLISILLIPEIFVLDPNTAQSIKINNSKIKYFYPGVDIKKFKPIPEEEKRLLRDKYKIPQNNFYALHVGHINKNRQLLDLAESIDEKYKLLFVGSTSTHQDIKLKDILIQKGAMIFDNYIEEIEEIYQLADCYIFHVSTVSAAIGVPLSVLEAMAVNLPIITTKFGGLMEMFSEKHSGLFFIDDLKQINEILKSINNKESIIKTREAVSYFTWEIMGKNIIEEN